MLIIKALVVGSVLRAFDELCWGHLMNHQSLPAFRGTSANVYSTRR